MKHWVQLTALSLKEAVNKIPINICHLWLPVTLSINGKMGKTEHTYVNNKIRRKSSMVDFVKLDLGNLYDVASNPLGAYSDKLNLHVIKWALSRLSHFQALCSYGLKLPSTGYWISYITQDSWTALLDCEKSVLIKTLVETSCCMSNSTYPKLTS